MTGGERTELRGYNGLWDMGGASHRADGGEERKGQCTVEGRVAGV